VRIFPGEFDGIGELYTQVKQAGLDLLVLSNTNADHVPAFRAVCPAMALFDQVYYSHEIHARKPNPRAYRHVTADWGVDPAACIFVDDRADNIEAAEALGMTGILAEGTASIRAELLKRGVIAAD
jgi:HAD superfamily hydrolase (TIGR01509 family)